MPPIFNDLFAFDSGLCHLRVYQSEPSPLALATELADNPGRSLTNAAEAFASRVSDVFGAGHRLFIFFPEPAGTWTEILTGRQGRAAQFRPGVAHEEIERLAGETVTLPAVEASSAIGLGGPDHPLLALIPPPEPDPPSTLEEMQIVSVADLPWPHNPSRCAHHARYETIRPLYDGGADGHIPAGAHFFLTLRRDDLAACRYHQNDWLAIAAASVEILAGLAPGAEPGDVIRRAEELLAEGPDQRELCWLFSHPITWAPGSGTITNGQHRTCAMKAAQAPHCAAVIYGETVYQPQSGEPRRRAQSTLAGYWAARLGAA
ncbi:MAG: hypothetical protein ABSB69_20945 [Solirubrobacteraceae bacterium]